MHIKKTLSYLYALYNYRKHGTFGDKVMIDASSLCQLQCPGCPRSQKDHRDTFKKGIGLGYLRFENFKKIVDANPWIRHIEISNWGEIFLNPELKEIIEYSCGKNISLSAETGVNLNTISEETIGCLVKNHFEYIVVAIDGATDETYEIYRRKGDFRKVLDNIEKINSYKRKYNSNFPVLGWQFIIFGHNEHELPTARKIANELNMEFIPKLQAQGWNPFYSPVRNKEFVIKESGLGFASRSDFEQRHKRNYSSPCDQFWTRPQINWDGRLLGCCSNIYSDFGNVFKSGLAECLKSERYLYAKKMLLGKTRPRIDIACSNCPRYRNRFLPKIIESNFFFRAIEKLEHFSSLKLFRDFF